MLIIDSWSALCGPASQDSYGDVISELYVWRQIESQKDSWSKNYFNSAQTITNDKTPYGYSWIDILEMTTYQSYNLSN